MFILFLYLTFIISVANCRNPLCSPCSEYEVWNECGSPCIPERSCQNRNPKAPEICQTSCIPRCECDIKRGYIRDEKTGKCVQKCPDGCSAFEVFNECGSACVPERSCFYRYPISPKICGLACIPRCECNKELGLIRDDITKKCVEICPEKCGPNQIFGCKPCCTEPTCEVPRPPPCTKPCPFICIQDCVCKEGYVRDTKTGRCILERECKRI